MNKIPEYVLKNSKTASGREWKSKKRKQIRAVIRAIEGLRSGCVYLPKGGDLDDLLCLRLMKNILPKKHGGIN